MIADLTPSMTSVLASIGNRSVTAPDLGVNGCVLKRLWELGFLNLDMPPEKRWPPYYSLSAKGEGAASILNSELPVPPEFETPIARIKRITAAEFRIPVDEMVSARRSREVARPRQVAMYICKRLTPRSLPDIGRHFGNRDHTTVIHAVRTVERIMGEDEAFRHSVKTIISSIVSSECRYSGDNRQQSVGDRECQAA
jgi:hypothetical protein